MDEYPACDSLPNKFIHNKLPICSRMASWGTRDLILGLGFVKPGKIQIFCERVKR